VPIIQFEENRCESITGETLLECLDRHNCPPPSSCQSGLCHTCLMRCIEGKPPENAQIGLKSGLAQQGYFLPCVCYPESDMTIVMPDQTAVPHTKAKLISKTQLTSAITRLRLEVDDDYSYIPGQYTNLFKDDTLSRTYSIASVPAMENYIECHIEKITNGKMSGWIFESFNEGDSVDISEALGECFYQADETESNLLMIATGSGFAPIYGIVRDALNQQHTGEIHVYHGAGVQDKIYLVDEMKALSETHQNLFYHPCLSRDHIDGFENGRANEIALSAHEDLSGWTIYMCGHPDMVKTTQRKAYLAGASLHHIHSDPFEFVK